MQLIALSVVHQEQDTLWSLPSLRKIGPTLWSWHLCEACLTDGKCAGSPCSWARHAQLQRYLSFHRELNNLYRRASRGVSDCWIKNAYDLVAVIKILRANLDVSRSELCRLLWLRAGPSAMVLSVDQANECNAAISYAIRLSLMLSVSSQPVGFESLELGIAHPIWSPEQTFREYWHGLFEKNCNVTSRFSTEPTVLAKTPNLSVWKLRKRLALTIRGTDDIANHLHVDWQTRVLYVFHHTAFLKEQLRLTKDRPTLSLEEGFKM